MGLRASPRDWAFTVGGPPAKRRRRAECMSPGFRLGRLRRPRSTRFLASLEIAFQSGRNRAVRVPERLAGRLAPSVPGCVRRGSPAWVIRPVFTCGISLAGRVLRDGCRSGRPSCRANEWPAARRGTGTDAQRPASSALTSSRRRPRFSGSGAAPRSVFVYSCCGWRMTSSAGPRSTTSPL